MMYLGFPKPKLYIIDWGGALFFHDTCFVQLLVGKPEAQAEGSAF
jgi:hypothetical protein